MQAQLHEPPPRSPRPGPSCPRAVDAVLNSALSRTPDERQESAGALDARGRPGARRGRRPARTARATAAAASAAARPTPPADDGRWSTRSSQPAARRPTASTTAQRRDHRAPAARRPGRGRAAPSAAAPPSRGASPRQATARTPPRPRRRCSCRRASREAPRRPRPPCWPPCCSPRLPEPELAGWTSAARHEPQPDPGAVAAQRPRGGQGGRRGRAASAWPGSARPTTPSRRLGARRAADRRRLAGADTPGDQAAAAAGWPRSYARARRRWRTRPGLAWPAPPPLGDGPSPRGERLRAPGALGGNGNRSAYRRAVDASGPRGRRGARSALRR